MNMLIRKIKGYWPLFKSLQTALLTITGVAGYMSARCPFTHWTTMVGLVLSLLIAISGSTVLNMWYDRDIDQVMNRTHHRPIARGIVSPREALILGLTLSFIGVTIAAFLSPLYAALILAGILCDVALYTILLKRRTCWSILWGGIAGGLPILAGRSLGIGSIDLVGVLMALSILFWIPTHILTFTIRYKQDYALAGIPTFPSRYGEQFTRTIIALSSIIAAILVIASAFLIGVNEGLLNLLGFFSGALLILAVLVMIRPSSRLYYGLFKFASLYMLTSMILLAI